jgi:hypothetical protein
MDADYDYEEIVQLQAPDPEDLGRPGRIEREGASMPLRAAVNRAMKLPPENGPFVTILRDNGQVLNWPEIEAIYRRPDFPTD